MRKSSGSRVRYVFTYGTLMSSAHGEPGIGERALMRALAARVGTAAVRGRMFDAGVWPGVVLGGRASEVVQGELWRLPAHSCEILAALDRYEGCAQQCPQPHAYARRRIRLRTRDGRRVTAWIYLWIGSTDGLARIADGRWRGAARNGDASAAAEVHELAAAA